MHLVCFFIFILHISFVAEASNISKNHWLQKYEKNLAHEFCKDSVYINQCFSKSRFECKKDVVKALASCKKQITIPNRLKVGASSLLLGEKLGFCVGEYMQADWKVKGGVECSVK